MTLSFSVLFHRIWNPLIVLENYNFKQLQVIAHLATIRVTIIITYMEVQLVSLISIITCIYTYIISLYVYISKSILNESSRKSLCKYDRKM